MGKVIMNAFELMEKLHDMYNGKKKIKILIVDENNTCTDEIISDDLSASINKELKEYRVCEYYHCENIDEVICITKVENPINKSEK